MKLFRSDEDRQRECTTDGEPEPRPTEEAIAALYRERQFERAESLINIGDLERAIVARDRAERNWKAAAEEVTRAAGRTGASFLFLRRYVGVEKNWRMERALNTAEGHIKRGVPLL